MCFDSLHFTDGNDSASDSCENTRADVDDRITG